MSAASALVTRLRQLLEGATVPRAIPRGRLRWTDLDQDLTPAAATGRPYPCGIGPPRKYQPMTTPSQVSGSHVWRGQEIVLWVAYGYDDHDRTKRHQELLDDEVMIHRCLSDPLSWLVDGIGIVEADDATVDDDEESRIWVLAIRIRASLREDYST